MKKHAVIIYLFLKGMSGKVIHDDMLATLGDNAPAYSVVKSWLAEFKGGRRPKTQQVPKMFKLFMTC